MGTLQQTRIGFRTTLQQPYVEAVDLTRAALQEQGFGVLTEIDVQRTLAEKLGAEFRPYVIFGACNPPLAHRALQADLEIGLLLPCNVIVYANDDGTSTVEAMDPEAVLGFVGDNPAVAEVAREAKARLGKALECLAVEGAA